MGETAIMQEKKMVAIHHREGSFSDKWIEYCQKNNIDYKLVNCYSSSIVNDLDDCKILMWHWHHFEQEAILMARQLIASLELKGINVFPNIKTCWHFDDKVGQKYLLESINAPMVKSYLFYTQKEAFEWIEKSSFPKVFKLRGGAGAINVKLIKNRQQAKRYAKKAFSSGIGVSRVADLKDKILFFKREKNLLNLLKIGKGIWRVFFLSEETKDIREKNYLYAQDFIANQDNDIRVAVIGNRAFAKKRMVREGDFRASGSYNRSYEVKDIPIECIDIAFKIIKKLDAQSIAFDFIFDGENYLIIELSYGFSNNDSDSYPGYWDEELNFISKKVEPEYFMMEDMLNISRN